MLRRIFAIVLIVLGLATAGAAVASGTLWRPADVVTATLPQDPDVPVVVAGGNVLATVNPNVTVTLTAADPETPLVLAMGREADVRAWLDGSPHLEITGLSDWETLSVADGPAASEEATEDGTATDDGTATEDATEDASPTEDATEDASPTDEAAEDAGGEGESEEGSAEAAVPDPAGSDLWIEEVTGTGELTYDWSQVEGRWMMLVATDGTQPAPDVSMTWTREVTTPLVVPGLIVGGVLFLIGLVWLVVELLVHREERRARRARWAGAGEDVPTVPTTAEDGTPLTRRQIREAARAAGRKPGAATAASTATAGSAAEPTTPASGPSPAEEPEESPSEWTAILTGAPSEPAGAGADGQQAEAGTPDGAEEGTETGGTSAAPASAANDLDEWVRSGRTGEQAGPVSTYESPAPGRGVGPEPGGELGLAWQGAPTSEEGAPEAGATDSPAEGEEKPRRWWQRRKRTEAESTAGAAPGSTPDRALDDAEDDAGSDAARASDAVDEPNPQASGASWRQTWGLTTAPDAEPADAEPADAEPADAEPADNDTTTEPTGIDIARDDEEGHR